ncbi:4'-phosphopantetheinyl transferase family protein [Methanolobus halotolerans]|uniref:4'-phosphopantetheinyl transferase domain-containing protein n=1 Tax=Methanolobus halotolerans TaxID=2052935 RepID=A0A4E0Q3W5_9EURY|nr:4'-phosphopantetheinyl transferase superfamily protein [Methanolobus halotolerans]TGC08305.1 hypothetical protein CUN85_09510 [Methanolobus halotolerans]
MEFKILNISSRISLEHIPGLWEENDILILIVNMNDYGTPDAGYLDNMEKEHLDRLQTGYFKKRFITSRMVLKCTLCVLLDERSVLDISLYKDEYGRIHVRDHNELNICISYTEDVFFLAISTIEVGIDVEKKRKLPFKNIPKYMQAEMSYDSECAADLQFLVKWTLKEAYCKFSNKSIFTHLNKVVDTNDISYSSYLINGRYILTVVTDSDQYTINTNFFKKIY